jgi:hypothetical protein
MSEPAKGTHWSNLISILGVGGKKAAEPAPPPPAPVVEVKPAIAEVKETTPAPSEAGDLQIEWSKPAPKKKAPEPKAAVAKKPFAPPAAAKPAARPTAAPKKKHWGSLAVQLGLPVTDTEPETSPDDEPTWIEESEKSGNVLSGDDAADECVSHPGGAACAPEECEVRSDSCQQRGGNDVIDTRDTEYLDDVPASDEDLDALADMINEGTPSAELTRREPRGDEDDFDSERPRDEAREVRGESREEGEGRGRRRRRRGRGRGRSDEGASERGPTREPAMREPVSREPARRDAGEDEGFGGFEDRVEKRREDSDEDLDRELRPQSSEEENLDIAMDGEGRREERPREGDRVERLPRRRRRRRRGTEESAEGGRSPRREAEPIDRVRGSDPAYRRKEEPADFDDELDGDEEPVAMHRNLPTWEDALSGIIGGNLENRARSPQPQYGNRGRGRDRDRGDRGGGRDRDRGGDRGPDRGGDRGPDRGPPRGRR